MAHALIRSLVVRPFFSMDLCFPQAGVLKTRAANAKLGKQDVPGFDLDALILSHLDDTAGAGPTLKPLYDSAKIKAILTPAALYILRNERQASDLDSVIHRRNVQYLEKYAHITALVAEWQLRYTSKLDHLRDLRTSIVDRNTKIKALMIADGEGGARAPESDSLYYEKLQAQPGGASATPVRKETVSRTNSTPVGMHHSETVMQVTNDQRSKTGGTAAGKGEALHQNVTKPTWTFPTLVPGNFGIPIHIPLFNVFESQVNYTEHFIQRTRRLDGDYRDPLEEEISRFNREIAALEQEIVDSFTHNCRLPHLQEIWETELKAIHEEIRRAQLAYIDTFLIPPLPIPTRPECGVITAINKDMGEYVQPGEAVVRIENAGRALLAGLLVYRDRLAVRQPVSINFRGLFEELPPGGTGQLPGQIVTIRGHDSDNDVWDVVIECDNWDTSLLPINYTFESTPDRYGATGAELQGAVVELL